MAKLRDLSKKGFSTAREIELLQSGSSFFKRLEEEIDRAQKSIHLQTYILDPDETGNAIMDALCRAAKRKVKVYLVLDAYGSQKLGKNHVQMFEEAGIHFKWFEPILDFKNLSIGRRMHHKIAVFDTYTAIVGGINFSNHYNEINNQKAWLDFAILIKGEIALQLEKRAIDILDAKIEPGKVLHPPDINMEEFPVRTNVNDWLKGYNDIIQSTRTAFHEASSSIIIVGSYFLPGRRLRAILRRATRRKVEVRIILAHVSDVPFSLGATRYFYRWMLKNNIKLYEWKHSVLHGKAAITDDQWVTIGSFNFNILSAFESIELNLEMINSSFATSFRKHLDEIVTNDCINIERVDFEKRYNFMLRAADWFSYHIVRYSMRFPLLFAKKVKRNKRKWR